MDTFILSLLGFGVGFGLGLMVRTQNDMRILINKIAKVTNMLVDSHINMGKSLINKYNDV